MTAFQFPWVSVVAVKALIVHWVGEKLFLETLYPCGVGASQISEHFWDGRVQDTGDTLVSQFGTALPLDPLVVAVHLPVVEIREMMIENEIITPVKTEATSTAGLPTNLSLII